MHPCCGIISLSVFILSILKLWTLCRKILKKIRMYPTTVVCLRNANSTRSRMAAWCHALSLAVQRLPAMNTVSFLSKSHHSWQAKLIILKPRPFKFLHYHWRTIVYNSLTKCLSRMQIRLKVLCAILGSAMVTSDKHCLLVFDSASF